MDDEDWDVECTNPTTTKPQPPTFKNETSLSNDTSNSRPAFMSTGRGRLFQRQDQSSSPNRLGFGSSNYSSNSKESSSNYRESSGNYRDKDRESYNRSNESSNYRDRDGSSSRWNDSSNYRDRDGQQNSGFNRSNDSIVDEIEIDCSNISAIIGRQGATISGIRDKCNVKINIPRREELENQKKTQIKIIGSNRDDVDKAKMMIKDITSS